MSASKSRDQAALAALETKLKQNDKTHHRLDRLNLQLDELRKDASSAGNQVLSQLDGIQKTFERSEAANKDFYDITLASSSSVRSRSGIQKMLPLSGNNDDFYECADVSMGVKVQMDRLRVAADALEALSENPVLQKGGLNHQAMELREELRGLYHKMSRKTKGLYNKEHMCIACGNCG